jgi:hypothetical protein
MKVHEPPNPATVSAIHPHQLLRGVKLAAQHSEHVHAGERLALEQDRDIVAVDLEADGLFESDGRGLMGRLLQHGSETEKLAVLGFVDDDLLVVLIDRRDTNRTGNHHVGLPAGVAHFVNALAWREGLEFHLAREDSSFVCVEQGEQGNMFQYLGVAGHRTPPGLVRLPRVARTAQASVVYKAWQHAGTGQNKMPMLAGAGRRKRNGCTGAVRGGWSHRVVGGDPAQLAAHQAHQDEAKSAGLRNCRKPKRRSWRTGANLGAYPGASFGAGMGCGTALRKDNATR